MRSTRAPSLSTSSTRRAHPARGGAPAWAGRSRVDTACTCVVPGVTGGVGGAALSRLWRRPPRRSHAGYPGGYTHLLNYEPHNEGFAHSEKLIINYEGT